MILAIDIGNTTIALAGFTNNDTPLFVHRLESDRTMQVSHCMEHIQGMLREKEVAISSFSGAVLSSVVPALDEVLVCALSNLGIQTMKVDVTMDTGIRIRDYDVRTLGQDRIVDAVSALSRWKPPLIIFDLGTATTVSVLDAEGCFVGGMILPGLRLCVDALSSRTAQLPYVDLEEGSPTSVIGKDTVSCLRNGAIIGTAAMIDGIAQRIQTEFERPVTIVATGGQCKRVLPWCSSQVQFDEHLLLRGLYQIYCRHETITKLHAENVLKRPAI